KAFEIADYDRNGWLSFRELKDSLGTDRPRYLVYDSDRNGKVTRPEFARLCLATYRKYGAFKIPTPNPADPTAAQLLEGLGIIDGEEEEPLYEPVDADSILELFGTPRPRPPREGSAPEPSLIQGPVHSFRRLDYDNDGTIGPDDLEVLLLGAGLTDRPKALIASIDTNGDGHLSEQEFQASMKHLK
ncbi:MAG: Ca2+-binding EF-hand superfamily protein, partial [Candidatus Paceibacteria bacterium]